MIYEHFIIPLNPVSKKNHSRIVYAGGHPRIVPSKTYCDYEPKALRELPCFAEPISEPVQVKALFYMKTHHRVDLVNLEEALLDVLVKGGVLADDNSDIVPSYDGSRVLYDKANPRTEVWIFSYDY